MSGNREREPAVQPEDLSRLFLERANAGDADGLVALYEPEAVLASPPGQVTTGSQACQETAGSPGRWTGDLPVHGHQNSWWVAVGSPGSGQLNGTTPLPARASASRWLSPLVTTRWAWCSSRSTVAVASVLGMIVSNPEGWMLLVTATDRRS
jgi:hypothetical protein